MRIRVVATMFDGKRRKTLTFHVGLPPKA